MCVHVGVGGNGCVWGGYLHILLWCPYIVCACVHAYICVCACTCVKVHVSECDCDSMHVCVCLDMCETNALRRFSVGSGRPIVKLVIRYFLE